MRNKIRGILLAVFSVVCILAMSLTGFAAGPLDGQIVDGSLLTSNAYAEDSRGNISVAITLISDFP